MDWRDYEDAVCDEFRGRYPKATISKNVRLRGRLSGVARQIDILIDALVAGTPVRTIVDTKMYNKPVDVKVVEEFLGLMADVEAPRGLMVTTVGYSDAAIQRAHRDASDTELDVMSLDEFKQSQGPGGFPFHGGRAVFLPAPFGWVLDTSVDGMLAVLYQRGRDFAEATLNYEWAYVNFWHKDVAGSPSTLNGLLEKQDRDLKNENANTEILHLDGVERDEPNVVRLAKRPHYPAWEYTGLMDFPDFMFFIVVFTLPEVAKRNLRKLKEMLQWVSAGQIRDERKDKGAPGRAILTTVKNGVQRVHDLGETA